MPTTTQLIKQIGEARLEDKRCQLGFGITAICPKCNQPTDDDNVQLAFPTLNKPFDITVLCRNEDCEDYGSDGPTVTVKIEARVVLVRERPTQEPKP